jgi:hypothetical protein
VPLNTMSKTREPRLGVSSFTGRFELHGPPIGPDRE